MTDQPPPVSVLRPDAQPELAALIERSMTPASQSRFGSAADMLAALDGRTGAAMRPSTKVLETPPGHPPFSLAYVPPRPARAGRRTKFLIGIGAGVAAALTATIVVAASQSPSTPAVSVPEPEPSATSPAVATPPSANAPAPEPDPGIGQGGNGNRGNGKGNGNGKKGNKGDG
jgi:serine/threonine-protein kinase